MNFDVGSEQMSGISTNEIAIETVYANTVSKISLNWYSVTYANFILHSKDRP